jgi:hypothetical protein
MEKNAAENAKLAAGPAQPGIVVLGGESRYVIDLEDDALQVYCLYDIVNTAKTPVTTPGPLVFDMPREAQGTTVLEGSSNQAVAAGARVTVTGPFKPGKTVVQAAYRLPYSGGSVEISHTVPAVLQQVSLIARKVGDMQVTSPQVSDRREMTAEGKTYVVANGGAVAAGKSVVLTLTGLPHRPTWPRTTALVLAAGMLIVGIWMAFGRTPAAVDHEQKLRAQRDRLFAELTDLEEGHRAGRLEPGRYESRRAELVGALERLYKQLDVAA